MSKSILTDQICSEVEATIAYFGAHLVKVGTQRDGLALRLYCRGKGANGKRKTFSAPLNGIDFRGFSRTQHHARAKYLRKVVGRALATLMEMGVDVRGMNRAA